MRWLALSLMLVACGGNTPPPEHGDEPERTEDPEPTPHAEPAADGDRALSADATFTDLMRAARALDDRRDQDSDAGCLLGRAGEGWRLAADLAVAVRPLARPPEDLDSRVAAASPVVVLSRWGRYGTPGEGALVLNAVTSLLPPRRAPAMVWLVTDEGVYVRSSVGPSDARAGTVEAARAALPEDVGALFVTAEGDVSLSRLSSVLRQVPAELAGRVALAVALAEGVRLPETPEGGPDEADAARCADGLPALSEDAPVGAQRPDRIVSRLGPLRQGAAICVGASSGAGGRVALAIRIGPDGRVAEACVAESEPEEPALHACLVRAARAIAFEAPDPQGYVDVQLPLTLAPLDVQRQRATCE